MLTSKKIRKIRDSRELLIIISRYKKVSVSMRNALFGIIAVIFFAYIFFLQQLIDNENEKIAIIFAVAIIFAGSLAAMIRFINIRGSQLVITEKGIYVYPYLAEFWEDIEGYGWETFEGLSKGTISDAGKGTSLVIVNKGIFQRNISRWSEHTILALYGLFFTPEDIRETEMIFQRFGIKKMHGMDYEAPINQTYLAKAKIDVYWIMKAITFLVVIPTSAILLGQMVGVIHFNILNLLILFGVIDTLLIIGVIWVAVKRRQ